MFALLVTLASIGTYLAVGFVYGRSQTVAAYQRAKEEWPSTSSGLSDRFARESMRMQVAWRILAWPWAVIFDAVRGPIRSWLDSPIQNRRDEADRLRAEADRYDVLIRNCDDPTDRDLMRKGQQALRDQARSLDL